MHLVQRDLGALPLEHRDVDLAHRRAPLGRQPLDRRRRGHDLAGLGLAGHAIGGVHGGAEHIAALQHHRPEVAADAHRNRLAVHLQRRVGGDLRWICAAALRASSAVGKVAMTSSPMVLMTVPLVLLGGGPHQVDAQGNDLAGALVAQHLVDAGRPDDVGEQDRQLDISAHAARKV